MDTMLIIKNCFQNRKFFFLIVVSTVISISIFYVLTTQSLYDDIKQFYVTNYDTNLTLFNEDDIIDFEGFDNVNGLPKNIIPNIVHLLYLQETELKFYQMINIFSIYLNHKPNYIYIHCDNCSFKGKYWDMVKRNTNVWNIIRIKNIPYKETIFGIKYGWLNHHRSDIYRLLVLMNYGGVYLDNDMYIVNSLEKYFKYEITVSWDSDNDGLGVQIIIAHRNARLLKAHYDSYRYNYTPSLWYWNAGHMPAKILLKHKYMAHAVKEKLGTHMLIHNLYKTYWPGWKDLDSIHLLINHRSYLDKESPIKEFNEFNILDYNRTYGFMVRDIMTRMNMI